MYSQREQISYVRSGRVASTRHTLLLDRWRLESLLHVTPLALTWSARDEQTGLEAQAVLPDLPAAPLIQRLRLSVAFHDAAQRAARLQHPHLTTPLDLGFSPAEEPVAILPCTPPHPTLGDLLHAPLPPEQALSITLDLLDALQALHSSGQTHRNLHPGAVLIDPERGALLVQDALGATLQGGGNLAALSRLYRGDIRFIAPEFALYGSTAPSVDLFQLALLLASMLLGRPLITEDTLFAVLRRIDQSDALLTPALRDLPCLNHVLRRALHTNPRQRPDATDLRDALLEAHACLQHAHAPTPQPTPQHLHRRAMRSLASNLPRHPRRRLHSPPDLGHDHGACRHATTSPHTTRSLIAPCPQHAKPHARGASSS